MTTIADLDYVFNGKVPVRDGVPYMAEGLQIRHVKNGFAYTVGRDGHTCRGSCEMETVPEGADGAALCWNCDSAKIPVGVLMDRGDS